MEDLYGNLENFTEEANIAELREENNILKIKIEEYVVTLDNLQKEFDMLSSAHKKLEVNFSSLLKTARSEIERKTQIITKLNIEKDAMVLNSIQNRNILQNRTKTPAQKINEPTSRILSQANFSNNSSTKPNILNLNIPKQGTNERKPDNLCPTVDLPSPCTNVESTVLHSGNNPISKPLNKTKNYEIKENIGLKEDVESTRARISNRRKSMPVVSMECPKFSSDEDEAGSTGATKEYVRRDPAENRDRERFLNEKPRNTEEDRMSRQSGQQEFVKDTKSRYNKYDSDKYRGRDNHEPFQRYRRNPSPNRSRKRSPDRRRGSTDRRRGSPDRRKGSPDRRRVSSEKNKRETRDYSEDFFKRQEYERRSRVSSPPRDKYYQDYRHRSHESRRSNEKNHQQDFEKCNPRGQDMYPMKHKMLHGYEEPSGKRMRLDSHPRIEEERSRNERQVPIDFDHLRNMSCQSPDQIYMDHLPSHQATEIKLDASMKLDDPRIFSKKYTLTTQDGKDELSTVESASIDVRVIDKSKWDKIRMVKMPDALLKKPITADMPSVVLHQNPMTTGMSSASLHKPMSSHMSNASVHKPMSFPMLDGSVHKPISSNSMSDAPLQTQNPKSSYMSDVSLQKTKSSENSHATNIIQKSRSTSNSEVPNLHNKNAVHNEMPENPQNPMAFHKIDNVTHKLTSFEDKISNPLIKTPKPDKVDMPDLLTEKPLYTDAIMTDVNAQEPMSSDDLVNEIYMDIEKISNTSMESNKTFDLKNKSDKVASDKDIHEIYSQQEVKSQKTENISLKLNNFKISKKSPQVSNDAQISKIDKNMVLSNKHNDDQKPTKHKTNNTDETYKKHSEVRSRTGRKIKQRRSSDFFYENQNHITVKDIEEDLELSDENSDNPDVPVKEILIFDNKDESEKRGGSLGSTKKHRLTSPDQGIVFEANSQKVSEENLEQENVKAENEVSDSKKSKSRKKSLKLKESKVYTESKDTEVCVDKLVDKQDNITNEPFENKDASLSMDQLFAIKENITKELLGHDNNTPSLDKSVKKKENKSKVLSKTKEVAPSVVKAVTQENQPKELSENKDTKSAIDKPVKKKEYKQKEKSEKKITEVKKKETKTKQSLDKNTLPTDKSSENSLGIQRNTSANTEYVATCIEKQVQKKDDKYRIKDAKFSELFGDSSSLVSPEDLGLIPAVIAPPENYVAIFEDAQDAMDIDTIRAAVSSASTENNNDTNIKTDSQSTKTITVDTPYQNSAEPPLQEAMQTESTTNQTMYQNLQSEHSPKDINVLKTVIISTGIQPQCNLVNDMPAADLHIMQCVKPTVLQALATSTPQKIWQQNVVPAEINPRVSNSKGSDESRAASINETPVIPISVATNASQTNNVDEPDMTIFVKRRRKVLRKK